MILGREFFEKYQLLGMKMEDGKYKLSISYFKIQLNQNSLEDNVEENVDWELFSKESELLDDELIE